MFNIFLRLITVLALVGLTVCGIGYLLPRGYNVETEIDIKAPPSEVFAMINSLPNWQKWSTWNTTDIPDLEILYRGQEEGVGSEQHWKEGRGSGVLAITRSDPESGIDYKMQFADFPEMLSTIRIEKIETGTRVVWTSTGILPSGPFYGYFAVLFHGQMQYEYDRGLVKLKSVLESSN